MVVMARVPRMTPRLTAIGTSGAHGTPSWWRASHDQLHADEGEHDRQALAQVDETVEQAADQEEQLPQAHQRERVGGEHDVGLAGQAEDGGIESRANSRSVVPMATMTISIGVTTRRPSMRAVIRRPGICPSTAEPADRAQGDVLGELGLFFLVADELPRGVDQEGAEDIEEPVEPGDRSRPRRR